VAAARRNGITLYAVLLGGQSRTGRNADLVEMLDWGFDQYRTVRAVDAGRTYAEALVPYGDDRLALEAEEPVELLVRVGVPLVERVVAPAMVDPPVALGQRLGEVQILLDGEVVARQPLVAAEAVEEPGFGDRVGWYADRALHHAGSLFSGFFGVFS
jgi:D-alanyl-D-alanine carboxypeptidase (penicillin-binding protein 5/6)